MPDYHVADVFHELRQLVARTLDRVQTKQFSLRSFDRILELTQCVPMTAEEYQTMVCRTYGAMESCLEAEYGAASFDLRLLLRSIERLMVSHVVQVRSTHFVTPRSFASQSPSVSVPVLRP